MAATYWSKDPSHPKNGTQRVVTDDADGSNHLEVFFNGSWMHDYRCMNRLTRIVGKNKGNSVTAGLRHSAASLNQPPTFGKVNG
ncbi:MAG: hypothetical protein ACRD5J_07600, partial [Nitrososphaeraceae archaeon]